MNLQGREPRGDWILDEAVHSWWCDQYVRRGTAWDRARHASIPVWDRARHASIPYCTADACYGNIDLVQARWLLRLLAVPIALTPQQRGALTTHTLEKMPNDALIRYLAQWHSGRSARLFVWDRSGTTTACDHILTGGL